MGVPTSPFAAPSMSEVEHQSASGPQGARQVFSGLQSSASAVSLDPGPGDGLSPALTVEEIPSGDASAQWPKKGSRPQHLAASFGASPYQSPTPEHPGLRVPLEHAGYVRTPSELVSVRGGYTEMATVFSSFDSTLGHRTLVGDRRWTHHMFISFAISSAHLVMIHMGALLSLRSPDFRPPK